MCVLIHQPAGKEVPEENLRESFAFNGDGIGISYVKDGALVVDKGWFKIKSFLKKYKELKGLEMIIHFRRASTGMVVNEDNCHPFRFTNKTWKAKDGSPKYHFSMAHNGRIAIPCDKGMSDTATFAESILWPILNRDPLFLDCDYGIWMMEKALGSTNKLVVLRYDTEEKKLDHYIIHKAEGNEAFGCWFSNLEWKPIQVQANHSDQYGSRGEWEGEGGAIIAGTGGAGLLHKNWYDLDDKGWLWDFDLRMWRNVTSQNKTLYLQHRAAPSWAVNYPKKPDSPGQLKLETIGDKLEKNKPGDALEVVKFKGSEDKTPAQIPEGLLGHMSKDQRKELIRMAYDHIKASSGRGALGGLKPMEAVAWMRSDVREIMPDTKLMKDEELDLWIVEQASIEDLIDSAIAGDFPK